MYLYIENHLTRMTEESTFDHNLQVVKTKSRNLKCEI